MLNSKSKSGQPRKVTAPCRRTWRFRLLTGALVYLLAAGPAAAGDGTAPPLDDLLAGEFALQEGRPAEAARHYADAALASRDPRLAERAAKLGLLAKQPDEARRVYEHWRSLEPGAASLSQFELALGLQYGDGTSPSPISKRAAVFRAVPSASGVLDR